MKINIYYGGRGILDDPTLFVINKMTEVLTELNVNVERFPLYELRNRSVPLVVTERLSKSWAALENLPWLK